jgi:hypothetical protein
MFPKTNSTSSGNVEGKEIQKARYEESKEFQREIQSLRLHLNITQSNVKEINKILKDLELAYKMNKKTITDFLPLLRPFCQDWSQCSSTQV